MGPIRTSLAFAAVAALALTVAYELTGSEAGPAARPEPPRRAELATGPSPQAEPREQWVATILARPLFASDRRPQATVVAATPNAPPPTLPRVTGILVIGDSKRVIFAGTGSGRPLVLAEGANVNGFRVQSIEPGRVTVAGPDGVRTLLPSFDPTAHAAPSSLPTLPQAAPPSVLPSGLPNILPPPNAAGVNGLQIPGLPFTPSR